MSASTKARVRRSNDNLGEGDADRESRYTFRETSAGFSVTGEDRVSVRVVRTTTGFRVREMHGRGRTQLRLFDGVRPDGAPVVDTIRYPELGFFQYRELVSQIAHTLMSEWSPRDGGRPDRLVKWALAQTKRGIGKKVHEAWKRQLAEANADVLVTQRAIFSSGNFSSILSLDPALYNQKYVVRDIQKYRAAASLTAAVHHFVADDFLSRAGGGCVDEFSWSEEECPVELETPLLLDPAFREYAIDALCDWQRLCSPTGVAYRSLRRTLMALPGGIPATLLCQLKRIQLERPFTDRLELIALLLAVQHTREEREEEPHLVRLLMHARRPEIRDAIAIASEGFPSPLNHRRTSDVDRFVMLLSDYPGDHRGRLATLARRSVRWHRNENERRNNYCEWYPLMDEEDRCKATQQPPIPLPDDPCVRFLSSVGDVWEEGERMQHCIGGFADKAVAGACYLFHVEWQNEHASVEISPTGQVLQAYGPCNERNAASRMGRRVLGSWGRRLARAVDA